MGVPCPICGALWPITEVTHPPNTPQIPGWEDGRVTERCITRACEHPMPEAALDILLVRVQS